MKLNTVLSKMRKVESIFNLPSESTQLIIDFDSFTEEEDKIMCDASQALQGYDLDAVDFNDFPEDVKRKLLAAEEVLTQHEYIGFLTEVHTGTSRFSDIHGDKHSGVIQV